MFTLSLKGCIFAVVLAFAICVILSPILIPVLHRIKFGQYIREEGPESHKVKSGTPTMGGIIILLSALVASLFFVKGNSDLVAVVLVTLGYGIIGFIDDFIKVVLKRNLGLRAWQKIVLQLIIFGLFMYYICCVKQMPTSILVPFTNGQVYWDLK